MRRFRLDDDELRAAFSCSGFGPISKKADAREADQQHCHVVGSGTGEAIS